MDDFEQILLAISGVGPARIRTLVEAGYVSGESIKNASVDDIANVKGISRSLAEIIHTAFQPVEAEKEKKTNLFLCPACGAFISKGAINCDVCGVVFEEDEEEDIGEAEAEIIEEPSSTPKKDDEADGSLYKESETDLFLCPSCGAFIPKGAEKCDICGVEFEEEEDSIEDIAQAMVDDAEAVKRKRKEAKLREAGVDGFWYKEKEKDLFLCPSCGSFLSEGAQRCGVCGVEFEEEAPTETEEIDVSSIKHMDPAKDTDGFWYKEGESAEDVMTKAFGSDPTKYDDELAISTEGADDLEICVVCGAFIAPDAEVCTICGAATGAAKEQKIQKPKKVASDFLKRWETLTSKKEMATLTSPATDTEIEDSLIYYEHLLEVDPTLVTAWEKKAEFLRKAGRYEEALGSYSKAAEYQKDSPYAYKKEIAEILYEKLGVEPDDALFEAAEEEAEIDISDEERQRIEHTLESYEQLLDEDPNLSNVWQLKGDLLEKLGRNEEALLAYDRAVESGDSLGLAQKMREKLVKQMAGYDNGDAITGLTLLGSQHTFTEKPTNGQGRTNGRTNGLVNGRGRTNGNGLVNGLGRTNGNGLINGNGRTNGRIDGIGHVNGKGLGAGRGAINGNGLVNGLGRTNGLFSVFGKTNGNGLINGLGRTNGNGLINGLGRTNGMGLINGNGLTNGQGLINGNGLINGIGRTNGMGLINGSGLTNGSGIVNGKGLVNGMGQFYLPRRQKSEISFAKSAMGIGFAMVLIMILPLLLTVMYSAPPLPDITVDGEFGDWIDIEGITDPSDDVYLPSIDILTYKMYSDNEITAVYLRANGTLFNAYGNSSHSLLVLIDGDDNASTGYTFKGMGVESIITVSGWEGIGRSATLKQFNDSYDSNVWGGFSSAYSRPTFAAAGEEMEVMIPSIALNRHHPSLAKIAMLTMDENGARDTTDTPMSNEGIPMVVRAEGMAPSTVSAGTLGVEMVSMELSTRNMNASVNGLEFSSLSSPGAYENIRVYEDTDGSGLLELNTDAPVPANMMHNDNDLDVNFPFPLTLRADTTNKLFVLADISPTVPSGTAIGITPRNQGVAGDNIIAFLYTTTTGNTYIDAPPWNIAIDGAFADWDTTTPAVDAYGDVTGGTNDNPDLAETRASIDPYAISFYVQVHGRIMLGEDILTRPTSPQETVPIPQTPPKIKDSDGDGYNDTVDLYPYDFDNDLIDDVNDTDKDNDGVIDYDVNGTDLWLNQSITGRSIYIGPPIPRPDSIPIQSGEDMIIFYVDLDDNRNTGYWVSGLTIGADAIVTVRGRDGIANNATYAVYNTSSGYEEWTILGQAPVGNDYNRVETQIPASMLISGSSARLQVQIIAWNDTRDGTDIPVATTRGGQPQALAAGNTRAGIQTKNLHMHPGNSMSTFPGAASSSIDINKGGSTSWTQTISFVDDFTLDGPMTVTVYATQDEKKAGIATLTLTTSGGTTLGSASVAINQGRNNIVPYTFVISPSTGTIPAGESIIATYTSVKKTQVWFNSPTYDSRIDIPTLTYVDVSNIYSYNSTAQTNIFLAGDQISIAAIVSDPFGAQDISGANVSVYYPNGTLFVSPQPMSLESTDPGNLWNRYNYTTNLPLGAPSGVYTIDVEGIESNGVTSNYNEYFTIPSPTPGVDIYPDNDATGSEGQIVAYVHHVTNLGAQPDTFDITYTTSQGWTVELYQSDGITPLLDTDGDTTVDTGAVTAGNTVDIVVRVYVPIGATGGIIDATQITATSSQNTSISGDAWDNTTVATTPPAGKTLHLHPGDAMDTFPGAASSSINLQKNGATSWTQTPLFASDFDVNSTIVITIYATQAEKKVGAATVTLTTTGGTPIGSATLGIDGGQGNILPYTFIITPSTNPIPAGESFVITYSNVKKTNVWFNSPAYDSRLDMATNTYVNVTNIASYNATEATTLFSSGDQISISSIVSDPFGAQDISGALLDITDPEGGVILSSQNMPLISTDPGNFWNLYNYTFNLAVDAPVGDYLVNVTGVESNGVIHKITTAFTINANVTIEPDNNATVLPWTNVTYTHWINNTGRGSDLYNIQTSSTQGWNTSIYDGATLMANDTNGDGIWDYVNPAYDTDGDGAPDTTKINSGTSFPLTVIVEVPGNAINGTVDVTTILVVNRKGTASDTATDTTTVLAVSEIPEFSDMMVPMASMLILFWVARKGKGNKKKTDTRNVQKRHSPNSAPSNGCKKERK